MSRIDSSHVSKSGTVFNLVRRTVSDVSENILYFSDNLHLFQNNSSTIFFHSDMVDK